ncbi:MAG TPA: ATP-binding protein [Kofleriaceae bacterium]
MSFANRPRVEPYVVALISVAGAALSRLALEPFLGGTQIWLTFWPATFLAAWFGGLRAGVTAVLLSLATVSVWLLPESAVLTPSRAGIGAVVFAVCGIGFAYVSELARRSRSEERRLREIAEASQREALAASRAKDEFLAVLGHELRNPLAPISSAASLMRLRTPESNELDVIERQVKHMSRLIDDLLDISRIVRGQLELQRSVHDLAALVEKATEMVMPRRQRSGHRFEIEVPTGIYIDGDAQRLVQVLTNILVNAIKFSSASEPIKIAARRDGERVVITVTDHGIGMDDSMLKKAFEPFVQARQDSDRASGGLGLGLAIARRLTELHGGELTAASTLGKGTTLTLTLPITHEAPSAALAAAPAPPTPTHRILVVDDNEDGAQMLGDVLQMRGHEIKIAFDGPAALEVLQTFAPTLALVDIGLPGMDGHELARKIRERGIKTRLVAVTGYGRESDRERALAAGFDEHLVKPVNLSRLEELIRALT